MKDRKSNLIKSIQLLENSKKIQILNISSIYESLPLHYTDQEKFLNMVIKINSDFSPQKLLDFIKEIECKMGRISCFKNGPRLIDIDILSYGNFKIASENLNIPHIRIKERRFVLLPWSEIESDFKLPDEEKNISEMLFDTNNQDKSVWKIKN